MVAIRKLEDDTGKAYDKPSRPGPEIHQLSDRTSFLAGRGSRAVCELAVEICRPAPICRSTFRYPVLSSALLVLRVQYQGDPALRARCAVFAVGRNRDRQRRRARTPHIASRRSTGVADRPNILAPADIRSLSETIRAHFSVDHDAEFAVEMDPRHLNLEQIHAFGNAGILPALARRSGFR